jgi:hypothetical protein
MTENTINFLKRKYPSRMGRLEIMKEFLLSPDEYSAIFGRSRIFDTTFVINILKKRI